jgi:CDP-diacylglycerol--glycerol-3-phosphate 3-phosphatidyltransferase
MMTTTRGDWQRYAANWAAQHGGYDLRRAPVLVRRWQRLAYGVGRLLVLLRVPPGAVTLAGLAAAVAAAYLAGRGGTALLVAACLVPLAAFAAAVDTSVGLLAARPPPAAAVRLAVAGRLGEVAWLTGFWAAGVAGPLVVACGVLTGLHEYVRARALAAGMSRIGAQTTGDRSMRVAVAAVGFALAALAGPRFSAGVLTLASAVWLLLASLGLGQLLGAVRRSLG